MNVVVIIQARMNSTRLQGKVLLPLAGKPLLERMIERVRYARTHFRLIVATTTDPADDPIRNLCAELGVECFSGDPYDLLDRHYRCARWVDATAVVKIPSDCPLIDPNVIDLVLAKFIATYPQYDYVSNLHPATFPDGNDVEIMKFSILEKAWHEASKDFEREHTTPYIWEQPNRFTIGNVKLSGCDMSMSHRWTIDYEDDYRLIALVFQELYLPRRPVFTMHEILDLIYRKPEIAQINAHYAGVNWYRNHLHELKTINAKHTRFETAA